MIDHTRYDFGSLSEWLHFCEEVQDAGEAEFGDPEQVDEIQYAVRLLVTALGKHPEAWSLVNLWLAQYGRWRLVQQGQGPAARV